MEKVLFVFLLLISIQSVVSLLSLNMTYHHTATINKVLASQDGKTIVLIDESYMLVYLTVEENGLNYQSQIQMDNNTFNVNIDIYFSQNSKEWILRGKKQFVKLQIINSSILNKWRIQTPQKIRQYVVSGQAEGVLFAYFTSERFWLYQNKLGQPTIELVSNFSEDLGIKYISIDGTLLGISCANCTEIKIYMLKKQPQFEIVFLQQIIIPAQLSGKKNFAFEKSNRFLAFFSEEKLHIYKRNMTEGGIFQFHQQIQLPYTIKQVNFVDSDLFAYYKTGNSIVIIKLELVKESEEIFEIVSEEQIFIDFTRIEIRQNYTLFANNEQLIILYNCPENCASCNPLKECQRCQEGYHLEQKKCRAYDNCLLYQDDMFSVCQQYCSKKCISCKEHMDNCITCEQPLYNREECSLNEKTLMTGVTLLLLLTVRLPRYRIVYMIIGNLQLCLYHKITYDGVFQEVLNNIRSLNAVTQSLMLTDFLKGLFQGIQVFTNYNAFANQKYLKEEGMNGIFATNFVALSLPLFILKTIAFFVLNWIFYRLFDKKISKMLRIYSFKLYLVQMLLIAQLPNMVFVFLYNSNMLFRINSFKEICLHSISVTVFGLFLAMIILVFFFYRRNYGKLQKYFYSNCVPKRGALQYLWNKYVIKSICFGALHAILYEYPSAQLLSLALLEVISMILTLVTSVNYKIFISQIRLCLDFLTEFALSILNIFLCLKFVYSKGNQEMESLIEKWIKQCIWGVSGLLFFFFAVDFIQFVISFKKFFISGKQEEIILNIENREQQKMYIMAEIIKNQQEKMQVQ